MTTPSAEKDASETIETCVHRYAPSDSYPLHLRIPRQPAERPQLTHDRCCDGRAGTHLLFDTQDGESEKTRSSPTPGTVIIAEFTCHCGRRLMVSNRMFGSARVAGTDNRACLTAAREKPSFAMSGGLTLVLCPCLDRTPSERT